MLSLTMFNLAYISGESKDNCSALFKLGYHFAPAQNKVKTIKYSKYCQIAKKTLQELRMLSSVTINCQVKKIVMNSGSQLSEL